MTDEAGLVLRDVVAGYGRRPVLRGISFSVAPGRALALLGPNGAGKTTTLRAIIGRARRVSGSVEYRGIPLPSRTSSVLRHGICMLPQGRQLFSSMSVFENLLLGSYRFDRRRRRGMIDADLGFVFDLFPPLRAKQRERAGNLSGGQQQMLAIGRALMTRPQLLLLDEPSLGLSPLMVAEVVRVLRTLRDEGMSLLLAEQAVGVAYQVADRAVILRAGELVYESDAAQLRENVVELSEGYFGTESSGGPA